MNVLGYKPVNGSREIQTNLTVSLLKDNYEALKWFNESSKLASPEPV